jgi:hypothetical protein
MAELYVEMAALPIPYIPQILHIDPLRLGSGQGRARVLTVMIRHDVFERKGAFMPPLSYQVSATSPPLRVYSTPTKHHLSTKGRVMGGCRLAQCTAKVTLDRGSTTRARTEVELFVATASAVRARRSHPTMCRSPTPPAANVAFAACAPLSWGEHKACPRSWCGRCRLRWPKE